MKYPMCTECDRPMRPHQSRREDHPGTVIAGAKGLCSSCYYRSRQGQAAAKNVDDYANSACVLVRVDITPNAYKVLNAANIDIAALLSNYAGHVAAELAERSERAA